MFSYSDTREAVLLLILCESSIFTVAFDVPNMANGLTDGIVRSIRIPWIDGFNALKRSDSEFSCSEEMEAYLEGLDARESWAQEMWDASTKMQSGILQGNYMDLGMYRQCVGVEGSYNNVTVRGKHCTVTFSSESQTLMSSVCLPSSCNESQALDIANSGVIIALANNSLGIELQPVSASCVEIESAEFSVGEILTITLLSTIGGFMLICTICDFLKRIFPKKTASVGTLNTLVKFSVYKNTLALLDTKVRPGTLPAINGIRFLSTIWLVAYHLRTYSFYGPVVNSSKALVWSSSWIALWYQTGGCSTNNFFLISGFFVSYLFFKKMRSGGEFNLPMMYLHRYIRLTPGIGVVGLFAGFLYDRLASGPLWETLSVHATRGCRANWWKNLLYIQNFSTLLDICIVQGWFLAADMQLFIVSPIILYPLHRWPKYGLGIWSVFFLTSIIAPALVIGLNGYIMLDPGDGFDYYHIRPYTRACPYLIGLLLAYDVITKKRRFSKVTVALSWIGCGTIVILCCLAMRQLRIGEYNLAFETACAALLHQSWSIAMAWVIYATTHGHGGLFARFLSSPIFLPLSRISFGIYLTHIAVIIYRIGSSKISSIIEESELFDDFLGVLVLSISVAALLNVFVDTPVMIFETSLKTRSPKQGRVEATPKLNEKTEENIRSSNEDPTQIRV